MTIGEARQLQREYYNKKNPTEADEFLFVEAMRFLIDTVHDPEDLLALGGWYYGRKQYEAALKYYELADACGSADAALCLGYIWYYGRVGAPDYEKAFRCYSASMERGSVNGAYKVADMYRNGYYVEKDEEKYREIIEGLYDRVRNARYTGEHLPEVFTRLARIRTEQGRIPEAVSLYLRAKDFLAQRISYDDFFGNLSIMKGLIDDLYQLAEFDPEECDFYDLYWVLREPARVTFRYRGKEHTVVSEWDEGTCAVCLDGKWFRSRDEFFARGAIDGKRLTGLYRGLTGFEVER